MAAGEKSLHTYIFDVNKKQWLKITVRMSMYHHIVCIKCIIVRVGVPARKKSHHAENHMNDWLRVRVRLLRREHAGGKGLRRKKTPTASRPQTHGPVHLIRKRTTTRRMSGPTHRATLLSPLDCRRNLNKSTVFTQLHKVCGFFLTSSLSKMKLWPDRARREW